MSPSRLPPLCLLILLALLLLLLLLPLCRPRSKNIPLATGAHVRPQDPLHIGAITHLQRSLSNLVGPHLEAWANLGKRYFPVGRLEEDVVSVRVRQGWEGASGEGVSERLQSSASRGVFLGPLWGTRLT